MLNVSIVKSNNKTSINGIEVKSAIEQKNIQEINLPVITSDNDDDVDIILSIRLLLFLVLKLKTIFIESKELNVRIIGSIEDILITARMIICRQS